MQWCTIDANVFCNSAMPSSSRWLALFSSPVFLIMYWSCKEKINIDQCVTYLFSTFPLLILLALFFLFLAFRAFLIRSASENSLNINNNPWFWESTSTYILTFRFLKCSVPRSHRGTVTKVSKLKMSWWSTKWCLQSSTNHYLQAHKFSSQHSIQRICDVLWA